MLNTLISWSWCWILRYWNYRYRWTVIRIMWQRFIESASEVKNNKPTKISVRSMKKKKAKIFVNEDLLFQIREQQWEQWSSCMVNRLGANAVWIELRLNYKRLATRQFKYRALRTTLLLQWYRNLIYIQWKNIIALKFDRQ